MKTGYSLYRTFDAETDKEIRALRCTGVRGDMRYVIDCARAYLKYAEPGTYRIAEIFSSLNKPMPALTGKDGTPKFCKAPPR